MKRLVPYTKVILHYVQALRNAAKSDAKVQNTRLKRLQPQLPATEIPQNDTIDVTPDRSLPQEQAAGCQGTDLSQSGYEDILAAYYHLAMLPELSEVEAKRLEKILAAAQADAQLSGLMNQIDELTFQQWGFLDKSRSPQSEAKSVQMQETLQQVTWSDVPQSEPRVSAMPGNEVQQPRKLEIGYEKILAAYYRLATRSELSELEAKRLEKILAAAQTDERLSDLMNQIDELTFQQWGLGERAGPLQQQQQTSLMQLLVSGIEAVDRGDCLEVTAVELERSPDKQYRVKTVCYWLGVGAAAFLIGLNMPNLFSERSSDCSPNKFESSQSESSLFENSFLVSQDRPRGGGDTEWSFSPSSFENSLLIAQNDPELGIQWPSPPSSFENGSNLFPRYSLSLLSTTTQTSFRLDENLYFVGGVQEKMYASMEYVPYQLSLRDTSFYPIFDYIMKETNNLVNISARDLENLALETVLHLHRAEIGFIFAADRSSQFELCNSGLVLAAEKTPEPSIVTSIPGIGLIMLYIGFRRRKNQRVKAKRP